jgi:hypothetical protein
VRPLFAPNNPDSDCAIGPAESGIWGCVRGLEPGFITRWRVPVMIAGVVAPDVFHLTVQSKELVFFGCMAAAFIFVIVGASKEIQEEAKDKNSSGHWRRMISI